MGAPDVAMEVGAPDAATEALRAMSEAVIRRWDERAPGHGLVVAFTLRLVEALRPPGAPLAAVRAGYDRRWGQLPQATLERLMLECRRIRALPSVVDVIAELLPWGASSESVASLLIEADALRDEQDYMDRTRQRGPQTEERNLRHSNLQELYQGSMVWRAIESTSPQIAFLPPTKRRRRRRQPLTGLGEAVALLGWCADREREEASSAPKQPPPAVDKDEVSKQCELPSVFGKPRSGPRRRLFRRGGDLGAWRNAPWDVERADRTLVIARLSKGTDAATVTALLASCGVADKPVVVRVRAEGGSKRGRERAMAFVEFPCHTSMRHARRRMTSATEVKKQGLVVDRSRRGVDNKFVPHRFQGEYFWNRMAKRAAERGAEQVEVEAAAL